MTRASFLQRLIGISGLGFLSVPEIQQKRKIYLLQSFIAGFRFHKGMDLLDFMKEEDLIELRREPENQHDAFAIALFWQQEKIGYVPAELNEMIARLMDANALPLIGAITHLNKEAKPWENVAIAVYFIQDDIERLPEHAAYLTQLEEPYYTTIKNKESGNLPHVLDYDERVIAVDEIEDVAARAYFNRYYSKYAMRLNNKRYVRVPDDGIYTYMYNVESQGWICDDKGNKYLEFVYNL